MKDMMNYKDYLGSVHYNDEDKIFFGKIEFIQSLISYEGDSVQTLIKAFEEAVDDYIELCTLEKKQPEKPFKGSFNIRVGSSLHRQAALYAHNHQKNINSLVIEALQKYLENHNNHI